MHVDANLTEPEPGPSQCGEIFTSSFVERMGKYQLQEYGRILYTWGQPASKEDSGEPHC